MIHRRIEQEEEANIICIWGSRTCPINSRDERAITPFWELATLQPPITSPIINPFPQGQFLKTPGCPFPQIRLSKDIHNTILLSLTNRLGYPIPSPHTYLTFYYTPLYLFVTTLSAPDVRLPRSPLIRSPEIGLPSALIKGCVPHGSRYRVRVV